MVPAQGVAALERHRVKQRQVKAKALQLLDQGLSPKEVAQRTDLAEHTVRTYLRQRFRASGMTREIVNHQVVIEGQIYVDEYYLMNDLGVSQPWINRLLQQLPVAQRWAVGNRGFRKDKVYLLDDVKKYLEPRVPHLRERDLMRALVHEEKDLNQIR